MKAIFSTPFGLSGLWILAGLVSCFVSPYGFAQTPPSTAEVLAYSGLFKAVVEHDSTALKQAIARSSDVDEEDRHGRTPLHVAAYTANHGAMRLLVDAGADPNALEHDRYDIVTIAAVADDLLTLELALELGASPGNTTSLYDGTALIAAAHLGHVEVVETLITAGAPLDHVNNIKWTALIESIVLGDGGSRHTATLRALVMAGANVNLGDGYGRSPLQLAERNDYREMVEILLAAGAK
jgi:ankyrin repeat protein